MWIDKYYRFVKQKKYNKKICKSLMVKTRGVELILVARQFGVTASLGGPL